MQVAGRRLPPPSGDPSPARGPNHLQALPRIWKDWPSAAAAADRASVGASPRPAREAQGRLAFTPKKSQPDLHPDVTVVDQPEVIAAAPPRRRSEGGPLSHDPFVPVPIAGFPMVGGEYFPRRCQLSLEVITVEEPWRRDEKLSQAVNALIPSALERKQGILVIQHGYGRYTVRIDHEVPCGVTHEISSSNPAKGSS